jgi:hypothetical protein
MRSRSILPLIVCSCLLTSSHALAAYDSGSTGADGTFSPASNTTINLALAGTGAGFGVYDSTHWAVVFNYTTVNIPAGVTVQFTNHPSGAPVVWLCSGNVSIAGTVRLVGANAVSSGEPLFAEPGPGGFAGGRRTLDASAAPGTAGFGPGGGQYRGGGPATGPGGGYGSLGANDNTGGGGGGTYGNEAVLPLIGGSGGAGNSSTAQPGGGGAGGGAILIASSGTIVLPSSGSIVADGGTAVAFNFGGGGGSGGAIRLVANLVSGAGGLRARGGAKGGGLAGDGGTGRIRVEAPTIVLDDGGNPPFTSTSIPGPTFPDANAPSLSVTSVSTPAGNVPVTADPRAGIRTVDTIVPDSVVVPVTVHISASNIPTGTSVTVYLGRDAGARDSVLSTPLRGTLASSAATATVLLSRGRQTEVFLKANFTPTLSAQSAPKVIRP